MTVEASVIDASGQVLGRLASIVAKRLLEGEKVTVVNAENAVISGRRGFILASRKQFLEVGSYRKGPFHPRRPDTIIRRTVRGMLPWKSPRGKEAYRRLSVHIGMPEEMRTAKVERIPEADAGRLRCRTVTVAEVAQEIGWKRGGG
ncbi:MAG: 50S ribosomal protein L13 [Candidatus Bathyarchaeia archaeon]